MTCPELATYLGVSRTAVNKTIERALNKLQMYPTIIDCLAQQTPEAT